MSSARILIVEDEYSIAADLERILGRLGYVVVGHAASGEQAIEMASATTPDLILMDIRLKGKLDGVEAAERILASQPVSIIYLTAYVDEETVARAKRTEPFGYLMKPFNEHQLRTTLEMALAKHAAELGLRQAHAELEQKVRERTAKLQQANNQLQAALHEKEILLKEIHHRVKNNLQVISSLLTLQSNRLRDPLAVEAFRESQSRIRAMALIHEKLYQSGDLAHIDFGDYMRQLTGDLLQAYSLQSTKAVLRLEVAKVFLGVDRAVPGGLIVNELVTNALKYAFPGERSGEIAVTLRKEESGNTVFLEVQDNGVGLPAGFDVHKTETLGLYLVRQLTRQLEGSLEIEQRSGVMFRVRFPLLESA